MIAGAVSENSIMHWKLKKEKLDFYDIKVLNIIEECKNIIKNKLIDIKIFDLYQGDEIKNGFKSISLRLILQDKNTTLTNKKINIILEKCITILKNKFKVEIRGISST
uniref:FDX-ACB domain-containing protein n=1 Tax=Glossina palpalis gambiensis TaxID=67801 RepID=A0A1B0C4X8_9MUSC